MRDWIDFSSFLKEFFPHDKVQKITLNAGFTCPTRDGSLGKGGCTYCNNKSFSPAFALHQKSVTAQLDEGVSFFSRKYPHMKYLAYFQSYTNTYGDVAESIAKYEEALSYPGVVGLIIGTRPDCMPQPLLDYFQELSKKHFLLIEYGVESTLDKTLDRIQRGHSWHTSCETIEKTHAAGIMTGAHLILGLPGESRVEILSHAQRISQLPIKTLKLHQLQIIKGTLMSKEYEENPEDFPLFTEEDYIQLCVDFVSLLREDIIIERFVSQSPPSLVIAPHWGLKNYEFTDKIRKRIRESKL
ncbi:TIGR01212 family radical SAM protein [Porphyromonas pogonae]|uniref:TIGR01212 family radical SAM protein n=1 Tax=Porphyromonas pogonae TaxID=867595 RepID=UPI002E778F17|nr:TIGR01212 family radical SAM protein [Porphyromonas pogonae]